ncbi:hypothetical protein [Alkalicoccus daliensis]|uniref:Uncharacterized protein n=1 Tax=Alkalicoccus daliensis TaxID=745820 RepID=A0A1H0K0L9_9BACI|nr:hypothetical protein [Alkalicoccus daliensis]SDO49555.1 hypothetical protein SAMN04488053_11563 [Alkalicoccus daliensis]
MIIITACGAQSTETDQLPEEMPEDFEVILQFGMRQPPNELNTIEETFTKDLITEGPATTEFPLSGEEREFIYTEMREANVLDVAENQGGSSCKEPHYSYDLEMTAAGDTYKESWDTSCENPNTNAWESFMDSMMAEIIEPRPEYQELPEPTGGYE